MEFLKKILGYIEEKMLAITIIATFLISIIVFKAFWVHLITIIWVSPIMSKLYGYELLIAFVYGAIIALYYYHKFKLTQYYNKNRVCYFGLLFLIYIICFFSKEWNFSLITDKTYFSAWTNLIFLAIIPEISLYLTCRKRKGITYNPQLEIEQTEETDDAYQRNGCCESVYKVINTCFFENQSFAVGIAGSWGSGKTTYINALKRRFNESGEDISVIDFEPWKNDNPSLIIKSFFSLLKSELKPHISNISIPIDKYVSSLLDCDVPMKWKFFLNTIHFLSVANKKSPYEQIKDYLKASKHRVVVFIDDIDRLDKDEIKEVLRLIRNTANFPYIQFIVAYDKDYIISTLKDSGIESPTTYLEKIFNLEITLPKYENRIVCSELEERLCKDMNKLRFIGFDKTIHDMIYVRIDNGNDKVNMYLVPCILTNIRDVIRYRNSFYMSMQMIKDLHIQNEIEMEDLFYVELLRYRYNDVYMFLRNRPAVMLKSKGQNIFIYNIDYLNSIIKELYNDYDQYLIRCIFNCLFNDTTTGHSLNKKRYFANYFMFRIDDKIFTEMDFMSLSGLNGAELSRRVNDLFSVKYSNEFNNQIYEMLENIYTTDSLEGGVVSRILDYKNIYDILKSILNSKGIKDAAVKEQIRSAIMHYLELFTFYDEKHLISTLELYNYLDLSSESSDSFIKEFLLTLLSKSNLHSKCQSVNIDNLAVIVVDFFKNIYDVVTMSKAITQFVESVSNEKLNIDDLVIDLPTLSKIKLDYFINYDNKLSDDGFDLFHNCIDYYNTDKSKVHLLKEACEVMKIYIEENPESYLSNFIYQGSSTDKKNTLYPEPFFLDIFGSNDNFAKFLEVHKSMPFYKIVSRFFDLYKFNDYKPLEFYNRININDIITSNFEDDWIVLNKFQTILNKFRFNYLPMEKLEKQLATLKFNIKMEKTLKEKIIDEYN